MKCLKSNDPAFFLVDELIADEPGSSTPAVTPPQPAAHQADGPGSSTPATNLNQSFRDLMPTPRIAKSNRASARKSINYTANVVSKQLFDDYYSKLQMNRKAKKRHE